MALQNVYVSTPTTSPSVLVSAAADAGDGSAADDGADEMVPMLGLHDDVDDAGAYQQTHTYLSDGTCFGHTVRDSAQLLLFILRLCYISRES